MSTRCTVEGCGKWSFQGGLCRAHASTAACAASALSPKEQAVLPSSQRSQLQVAAEEPEKSKSERQGQAEEQRRRLEAELAKCSSCKGTGSVVYSDGSTSDIPCPSCKGNRSRKCSKCNGAGSYAYQDHSDGSTGDMFCEICKGTGSVVS
jgi:hypothetical protein